MALNHLKLSAAIAALQLADYASAITISGDSTGPVTLFYNKATTDFPYALETTGGANTNLSDFKWEISNTSFIDEDTGKQYMELTTELTMPIKADDVITFHVQYSVDNAGITDDPNAADVARDGFSCKMQKSATSSYWDVVELLDWHYITGADAEIVDFNNQVTTDGQDWFVETPDSERSDNFCTPYPSTSDFQCMKLKCVVRKEFNTGDSLDLHVDPVGSTTTNLNFNQWHSGLLLNLGTSTAPYYLNQTAVNQVDLQIKKGAIDSVALSGFATLTALAFSLF